MLEENTATSQTNGSENDSTTPNTSATVTPTATTKETKRNWFYSLTRRKKSQSQSSLAVVATTEDSEQLQNNNNEPLQAINTNAIPNHNHHTSGTLNLMNDTETVGAGVAGANSSGRKRKESKNVFQRIRKKMGLRFHSLRQRRDLKEDEDVVDSNGTTDASAEFHSQSHWKPQLSFKFTRSTESVPFTHDFNRFIAKKWLEGVEGPNRIMYKASSEMLSQVWYWGEISRRDAQRQLTDKPTGSFLVRDSESNGCQFTLSFRIINVTLHYRLEYRDNYWHFEELQYESIVEMIEDILYRCTRNNFVCFVKVPNEMQPPFPVILKYPLSRYLRMPDLQDLCRRVIQKHATPEKIATLPIPPKLQEYVLEKRELVFQT